MNARETDGLRFVKLKLPAKKKFQSTMKPRKWTPAKLAPLLRWFYFYSYQSDWIKGTWQQSKMVYLSCWHGKLS